MDPNQKQPIHTPTSVIDLVNDLENTAKKVESEFSRSRELALVKTKLDEARQWAIAELTNFGYSLTVGPSQPATSPAEGAPADEAPGTPEQAAPAPEAPVSPEQPQPTPEAAPVPEGETPAPAEPTPPAA